MITFGNVDLKVIKAAYGTPTYLVDVGLIEETIEKMKDVTKKRNAKIAYASKAFLIKGMAQLVDRMDLLIDVVSGGELNTVLSAGMKAEKVVMHGNNKTLKELTEAVDAGVGRIVIDNEHEIELLKQILHAKDKVQPVLIRINPEVKVDTHQHISTGHKASKFGFPLDVNRIVKLVKGLVEDSRFEFLGLHFHVGSQLMTPTSHIDAVESLEPLYKALEEEQIFIKELNIGGGFGIDYLSDEAPYDLGDYLERIFGQVESSFKRCNLLEPTIIIEPGRSLVAKAGITLYEVGHVKALGLEKNYINVDGGLYENMRPALYDAKYRATLVEPRNSEVRRFDIAGSCCESGDILIRDMTLTTPEPGDLLVIHDTGAYHQSMASNYNKHGRNPVVFIKDGRHQLVSRRETYEDLNRLDLEFSL
ncbi:MULTISPECIES: diaminopimelate decarboxylase [unclassified Fusibacter]|uniref:diaminopimelate decarboxylase n=1 Tax=unclassified Fusibacter TaxID=2624464 RepID=UPI001013584D|nr:MULTISPECIES: diaminopimelate decarboxylase [unclassified Fusibacter]MCK8058924.1 diaminopimelate decarboxylase [Fusibacter sp. A2]NPE21999.1 diaminopimelate decarboxylase [Fusibacter sp. A1]RXV61564.1 diaminopimelate decarboxylase [Fusibacter sp. A1]